MSLKSVKNVSLDAVFVELRRMGITDLHEKDIVEWSGKALEAIGCINQYEEAVCFIEVKNHQASLPAGFHAIIQIAKNNCYQSGYPSSAVSAGDIRNQLTGSPTLNSGPIPLPGYTPNSQDGCPDCLVENPPVLTPGIDTTAFDLNTYVPTPIDFLGEPINEFELAYYRPFFDLQYEYSPWINSSIYQNCFSPVRLTSNSFFNTLVCQEKNQGLYRSSRDEYNIYGGDTLRFSFPEGQAAIAYTRSPVDKETGWPLIPDNISYITAAVYYNIWKLMERQFYAGRDGAEKRMEKAESQWVHYCGQAGNKALILEGIDEYQNFLDQRNYILPRQHRYNGFFGKLSAQEDRKFNNPDRNRFSLVRGL